MLVKVGPLLECQITQGRTTATGTIYLFANRPFNVIVFNPLNAAFSFAKYQRIAKATPPPLFTVQNRCDEPSVYITNPTLCENINLVHDQPYVERFQQMSKHGQVRREDGIEPSEGFKTAATIHTKYMAHVEYLLEVQFTFKDMCKGRLSRTQTVKHRYENDIWG